MRSSVHKSCSSYPVGTSSIPKYLSLTSSSSLKLTLFVEDFVLNKHSATSPFASGLAIISIPLSFLILFAGLPRASWSTAIICLFVTILSVLFSLSGIPFVTNCLISLPSISGAASIHQSEKCALFSLSSRFPLPTSSISGSFQWPAPAYL